MTFAMPVALTLLVPLAVLGFFSRMVGDAWAGRLPGAWDRAIATPLKSYIAVRSILGRSGSPTLCIAIAIAIVTALSRPGIDVGHSKDFATLAGRVVVLEVGADLARHRHFVDELHSADPGVATAIVAVSGDAYRIVPLTTDKAQIDRYLQVLSAEMMPEPGQRPHLGLAQAERLLAEAGSVARQIVFLSALPAPVETIPVPSSASERIVIPLGVPDGWGAWAAEQDADLQDRAAVDDIADSLSRAARAVATAELPAARIELTTLLIALAAVLWLLLFRRRDA